MKNLKKAKKIINVNYCFENGDELEIPFVYKPAVMNHIKLPFDEFLFNPMREKGNTVNFRKMAMNLVPHPKMVFMSCASAPWRPYKPLLEIVLQGQGRGTISWVWGNDSCLLVLDWKETKRARSARDVSSSY